MTSPPAALPSATLTRAAGTATSAPSPSGVHSHTNTSPASLTAAA
jgi:hypothetical protein